MLTELHITNLAIIERQTVSFGPGLNVISGETGAGKSIILQALELVLGGRAKTDLIREGADSLEVQALLDLSRLPPEIRASLPEIIEGDELLVSRSVNSSGKGKVFLNAKLASISVLQEVLGKIISICGQGQQMRLLERDFHTQTVDTFGDIDPLVAAYRLVFDRWRSGLRELQNLEKRTLDGEARREELLDRVKEIESAGVRIGRRDDLERQVKSLQNRERVLLAFQSVSDLVSGDDGALITLEAAAAEIERLHQYESRAKVLAELLQGARANLLELESEIQTIASQIETDEDSLEELEASLAEIARLQRKYRSDERGLLDLLESGTRELELIQDGPALAELRRQVAADEQEARKLAATITSKRKSSAEKLSRLVEPELAELNMPKARLGISLHEAELTVHGAETLELLISTNKGEPLKPLRQVASGGELSRILLVLKKVLRERSGVNVLIFDEVDTGVSGGVARAVGEKLKGLSGHSQVICITHLPQIASLADQHLLVEKVVGKRTISVVKELSEEEKVDEIARMLAGYTITAASRESARELMTSKSR